MSRFYIVCMGSTIESGVMYSVLLNEGSSQESPMCHNVLQFYLGNK